LIVANCADLVVGSRVLVAIVWIGVIWIRIILEAGIRVVLETGIRMVEAGVRMVVLGVGVAVGIVGLMSWRRWWGATIEQRLIGDIRIAIVRHLLYVKIVRILMS
jgi:hypothetical protein